MNKKVFSSSYLLGWRSIFVLLIKILRKKFVDDSREIRETIKSLFYSHSDSSNKFLDKVFFTFFLLLRIQIQFHSNFSQLLFFLNMSLISKLNLPNYLNENSIKEFNNQSISLDLQSFNFSCSFSILTSNFLKFVRNFPFCLIFSFSLKRNVRSLVWKHTTSHEQVQIENVNNFFSLSASSPFLSKGKKRMRKREKEKASWKIARVGKHWSVVLKHNAIVFLFFSIFFRLLISLFLWLWLERSFSEILDKNFRENPSFFDCRFALILN